MGEFEAEAFGFGEHSDQATFDGLGGAADEFRFEFNLIATLFGGSQEFVAKDGFVETKLLRDAGGPFGTQNGIRNFLNVGQQEIYGVALPFSGGEVHAARASDEVVDVGRRFFEELDVGVFALLANKFVGIGFSGKREDTNFVILLEQEGDAAFGGSLSGDVGVVVDDDAAREAREQFDLRFGESGAAAGDDVDDSSASDGDGIHVAFDKDCEIGAAKGVFGAVEVIEDIALRIDRSFGRVEILRHVVTEGAAAEGNDFSGFVGDGECDAATEPIEEAIAALIARDQAGFDEELVWIFCFELTEQNIAAAWGIADPELFDDFLRQPAIF